MCVCEREQARQVVLRPRSRPGAPGCSELRVTQEVAEELGLCFLEDERPGDSLLWWQKQKRSLWGAGGWLPAPSTSGSLGL